MYTLFTASLLAAGALSAPAPAPVNPGVKVPLPRRDVLDRATRVVDLATFMGHLNYTLQKYGKQPLKSYPGGGSTILKRQK